MESWHIGCKTNDCFLQTQQEHSTTKEHPVYAKGWCWVHSQNSHLPPLLIALFLLDAASSQFLSSFRCPLHIRKQLFCYAGTNDLERYTGRFQTSKAWPWSVDWNWLCLKSLLRKKAAGCSRRTFIEEQACSCASEEHEVFVESDEAF